MTRDQRERGRMDGIDARAMSRRIAQFQTQRRMADPSYARDMQRRLRAVVAALDAPAPDAHDLAQAYAELVDDRTRGCQRQLPLQVVRHA